jgi:hypothetical protein
MARSIDEEIGKLFALAPEEFTAARDRMAKDLKAGGDSKSAAEVKALRRPTLAAWAANQVVRREPKGADALLEAGNELRKAQRRALSGVSGAAGLREATERRRKAVRSLLKATQAILDEAGRASSPGTMEAIQATLEAASTDEEAGTAFRQGRLAKEFPTPAGFGAVEGLSLVAAPPEPGITGKKQAIPAKSGGGRGKGEPDAARLVALRKEQEEARRAVRDQERVAERARKDSQRASDAAVKAEEQAEEARVRADEARRRARELAAAARVAGAEVARTERESERARRALGQVEEALRGLRP